MPTNLALSLEQGFCAHSHSQAPPYYLGTHRVVLEGNHEWDHETGFLKEWRLCPLPPLGTWLLSESFSHGHPCSCTRLWLFQWLAQKLHSCSRLFPPPCIYRSLLEVALQTIGCTKLIIVYEKCLKSSSPTMSDDAP